MSVPPTMVGVTTSAWTLRIPSTAAATLDTLWTVTTQPATVSVTYSSIDSLSISPSTSHQPMQISMSVLQTLMDVLTPVPTRQVVSGAPATMATVLHLMAKAAMVNTPSVIS